MTKDFGSFFVFLNITNEENDLYLTFFFSFPMWLMGEGKCLLKYALFLNLVMINPKAF